MKKMKRILVLALLTGMLSIVCGVSSVEAVTITTYFLPGYTPTSFTVSDTPTYTSTLTYLSENAIVDVWYWQSGSEYEYLYRLKNVNADKIKGFVLDNVSHFTPSVVGVPGNTTSYTFTGGDTLSWIFPQLNHGSTIAGFYIKTYGPPGLIPVEAQDGGIDPRGVTYGPVPEPASMLLLGMGILGVFGLRRKKA